MLRHAGSIYALATYERQYSDEHARAAMQRAARFLLEEAVSPIPARQDLLAVWSLAGMFGTKKSREIKLGGTGLGLVALVSVEKLSPGTTTIDVLRKMGDFVLYMQKEDGSFHSKYLPFERKKDDTWKSLYYPGEAALGLLMLYEVDPSPKWLKAATDAIAYLARSRAGENVVEADHWALLATARLLPLYEGSDTQHPRELFIRHAIQICESMLRYANNDPKERTIYGSFGEEGSTCTTATILEGLLAALSFLPEENWEIKRRIVSASRDGILFLLRSQIPSGRYKGGIPRSVLRLPAHHPEFSKSSDRRATEIRIDYVQHALSAMVQYSRIHGDEFWLWFAKNELINCPRKAARQNEPPSVCCQEGWRAPPQKVIKTF